MIGINAGTSYEPGSKLGFSIQRLSDDLPYDFATSTFIAAPTVRIMAIPEGADDECGSFLGGLPIASMPPAQFTDGDYVVRVHNTTFKPAFVVCMNVVTLHKQSDGPVFPVTSFVAATAAPVIDVLPPTTPTA